ncbi:cupin domain-containing protein [Hyphomicrobium facile]|uniref:Cupin domain protein n=1 Tax=Hyphomicrobium facile TaxID=51670 RepID=A0A1I7MXE7_9HYPH|nr:cupin domain-containing protein [Hyphomicrobium facile]SFV27035.1 Cupin domain protein [Hyphomicrobium facile]
MPKFNDRNIALHTYDWLPKNKFYAYGAAEKTGIVDVTSKFAAKKLARILSLLILFVTPAFGHEMPKELAPEDIVYKDDPAFPKGAQTAVVFGDPSKPGLFVIRAKFPPHYVVPPHIHPVFEAVTVLSGTMGSGMGETVDKASGKILPTGSILLLPADHPHYVWAGDTETVVQVVGNGPFDLIYVNPADDPRKK